MEQCKYKLPCGWCDRKNEKCEMLQESVVQEQSLIDAMPNPKYCDHEWECCGISTGGDSYRCRKCGATKYEPVKTCVYPYITVTGGTT